MENITERDEHKKKVINSFHYIWLPCTLYTYNFWFSMLCLCLFTLQLLLCRTSNKYEGIFLHCENLWKICTHPPQNMKYENKIEVWRITFLLKKKYRYKYKNHETWTSLSHANIIFFTKKKKNKFNTENACN